jgi:nucleoside-diphosphate-sugar epimerase
LADRKGVDFAELPPADLRHILDHTRDLWTGLHGARIFLTGGTGFFGKWLTGSLAYVRAQIALDIRLTVLSRSTGGVAGFDNVRGDVRDFAFPDGGFTHVIHGATPASAALNNSNPGEMFDILVSGTRRVVEFCEASGAKSMLLCSSGAVYGRQPAQIDHVSEDYPGGPDPLLPGSAYAEGKRASELLCATASGLSRCVSARCFAFLGPHLPLDTHFAAGNFLGDALAGRTIVVGGDGTPLRSYQHPADLMIWLWTLLARGTHRRAYNVGSEQAVSIGGLAELIRSVVAPATRVEIRGTARHGIPPERYVPSTERARRELGLETFISLEDAIRRTAAWHRERAAFVRI